MVLLLDVLWMPRMPDDIFLIPLAIFEATIFPNIETTERAFFAKTESFDIKPSNILGLGSVF